MNNLRKSAKFWQDFEDAKKLLENELGISGDELDKIANDLLIDAICNTYDPKKYEHLYKKDD